VPQAVGDILLAVPAAAWLIVLAGYLRYVLSVSSALVRDVLDPVAALFASPALITPMLLRLCGPAPGRSGTSTGSFSRPGRSAAAKT
jgi:tellurite resistance protein